MTEEAELEGLLMCREWRLCNLYWIRDENGQIVPFVPNDEQLEIIRSIAEGGSSEFIAKSRQLGMSTLLVLIALDACIFTPNFRAAIIDQKQDKAEEKIDMAKLVVDQKRPRHPDPDIAALWEVIFRERRVLKCNESEILFDNGSSLVADVNFRGGTLNWLHCSELAKVAAVAPAKAEEIKSGAMQAVPKTGWRWVETTMEGGKHGVCYEYFTQAVRNAGRDDLTSIEWNLRFFPWHKKAAYSLPDSPSWQPDSDAAEYFSKLEARGIRLTREQQRWWCVKKAELRGRMNQEYPSTVEECTMLAIDGQIYPQVLTVRASGRVHEFPFEPGLPLLSSWDLGIDDALAGWLIQVLPREILWLDHAEFRGGSAGTMAAQIRKWEREFGQAVEVIYLPHDAGARDRGSGKDYRTNLVEKGISNGCIRVLPRCVSVWHGIEQMRELLLRSRFHSRCDVSRFADSGTPLPSGLGCLEGYRKRPVSANGAEHNEPLHDLCSHTADAARYLAEAWRLGWVSNVTGGSNAPTAAQVARAVLRGAGPAAALDTFGFEPRRDERPQVIMR